MQLYTVKCLSKPKRLYAGFLLFFFQAEDGIRDVAVTGVQTCALPISRPFRPSPSSGSPCRGRPPPPRSEEHTSELQSRLHLVCRLLLEKKKTQLDINNTIDHLPEVD